MSKRSENIVVEKTKRQEKEEISLVTQSPEKLKIVERIFPPGIESICTFVSWLRNGEYFTDTRWCRDQRSFTKQFPVPMYQDPVLTVRSVSCAFHEQHWQSCFVVESHRPLGTIWTGQATCSAFVEVEDRGREAEELD
jgi:hypothetical protein